MLTFKFYPKEFICCSPSALMSLEETGQLITDILKACIKNDKKLLNQFPFIEKITEIRIDKRRKYIPAYIRKKILSIGYCQRCGATDNLTIDHIKPFSKNGSDDEKNLQCLCKNCNCKKSAKGNCR